MGKKRIAIGVPCYNEEKAIPVFVSTILNDEGFKRLEKTYDFVFIFTDDGSKDNTFNLLESLGKERSNFYYISFDRNYGKEAGLVAIYNAAISLKVDALIKMDVDLQDPPSLLPKFIKEWEKGYVYVYGHCPGRKGQKLIKKLFSKAFYSIYHWITLERGMKDGDRDYALLDKSIFKQYASINGPYRFDRAIASHLKIKSTKIDYPFVNREDGTTRWPFKRLLKYSFNAFRQFGHLSLFINRLFLEFLFLCFLILLVLSFVYPNLFLYLFIPSMVSLLLFVFGIALRIKMKKDQDKRIKEKFSNYVMYRIKKTNIDSN